MKISRRTALSLTGAAGATLVAAPYIRPSYAQARAVKVGLLLPFSGTFAQPGEAIANGFMLYYNQNKAAFGGRELQIVRVDDESLPPKGAENTNKLVLGEKVDVLVGTVHSGVALAMSKIAREAGLLTIIPNAGANDITGGLCAPNIFRSSFDNGQPGFATGVAMLKAGIKEAMTFSWRYAAGAESNVGFKSSFVKGGGKIIKEISIPFPDVQFQSSLTEIASIKPPAVYSFFAGGGAAKYINDWAGAKLNQSIQLWGPGFLTDGLEKAVGANGNGIKTALHYVDDIDTPTNKNFRATYQAAYKSAADVFAVQGYDAAQMLAVGLAAANGDVANRKRMFEAIKGATYNSPRGNFKLSAGNNPIQDFYLRELRDGVNHNRGLAAAAVGDSTQDCKAR